MKIQLIVERCDPRVKVSRSKKDATLTRDDVNTTGLLTGECGGGEEGGIGISASKVEGSGDAGAMGVVVTQSINTVCRSPVQGTIVEKR